MKSKNHRAPLAFALAALIAATFVPVSGADSEVPFYESIAEPGAPDWRITKLLVTEEGVSPTLKLQFTNAVCPLTWGFQFLVGSAESATVHNGLSFMLGGGAGGVATSVGEVEIERDPDSQCASRDIWTILFGELPLGTVYLLETRAGSDFQGWARIHLSGPGVEKVGESVGHDSNLLASDQFEGGTHVAASNPGVCFLPRPDGGCDWAWAGGSRANLDVGMERSARATFQYHPWFAFQHFEDSSVGNASMTDPLGGVTYATSTQGALGLSVDPHGIGTHRTDLPAGDYTFTVDLNADANPSAWWLVWFDLRFPEEVSG